MVLARAGHVLGVTAYTAVEAAALGAWLAIVRGETVTELPVVAGFVVLFAGLLVEGTLTHLVRNGRRTGVPLAAIGAFSLSETVVWLAWLAVAGLVGGLAGVAVASVVLGLLLVPQHTVEENVLDGDRLGATLVDPAAATRSAVEAVAAGVWLALVVRGREFLLAVDAGTRRLLASFDRLGAIAGPDGAQAGLRVLSSPGAPVHATPLVEPGVVEAWLPAGVSLGGTLGLVALAGLLFVEHWLSER